MQRNRVEVAPNRRGRLRPGRRRDPHRLPPGAALFHPRVAPTFVLKYNIRTRFLADPGAIEDILAVEDDIVPFDRADVLGAGLREGLPW